MRDLAEGCAELERVLSVGARLIHRQAGPIDGRSPADPHFAPFRSRIHEAGVPVVFHTGDPGYLFRHLDKKEGMGRQGPWPGGCFKGRPSEILKEHLWLAPYPEDDVMALVERMGEGHVLFGSDYPHPEGLALLGLDLQVRAAETAFQASAD